MRADSSQATRNYAAIIFAACFLMQAVGIGIFVAFGVFFTPLLNEFQCPRVVISGASSLSFMTMGVVGILIGRLNDRYGPRLLMAVTSLFFGAGFVLMSQINSVWQLYFTYGILVGIGFSSIDVIALTTIARWFTRRRGMMTGLAKVGTGAGQFVIPLVASLLISAVGWRQTAVIIGVTACVILFGISRVLKRDPGEMAPDGKPESSRTAAITGAGSANLSFSRARSTYQFWILCVVNMLVVLILISIIIHIVPHGRDMGLSATQAASVLSAIGGVSMVGRFLSGISIDRWGSKRIMVICFFLLTSGLLLLQFATTLWLLYLFACIYGLAHGGFFTAVSPIAAEIFGIRAHGTILGIIVCFGTTGGSIGPLVAGQLFDMTGSYTSTFWALIVISLLGLTILLPLKPVQSSAA